MLETQITYLVAFFAGVVTFFASCLLPLVPLFLMYLTRLSVKELKTGNRARILKKRFVFTCGFVLMFVLIGAGVGIIGKIIAPYALITNRIIGILFILMGLSLLNIIPARFLPQKFFLSPPQKNSDYGAFFMGAAFALTWTPCVGPVLSVILFWSSQQETLIRGTSLLLVYGLGIGIPFIITGLLFETISPLLRKLEKLSAFLHYISAIIILLVGTFILFGYFQQSSLFLLHKTGLDRFAK